MFGDSTTATLLQPVVCGVHSLLSPETHYKGNFKSLQRALNHQRDVKWYEIWLLLQPLLHTCFDRPRPLHYSKWQSSFHN